MALYLFSGPTLREVVQQYTQLTGRTPLPPLWSLGAQQNRWGHEKAEAFSESFKVIGTTVYLSFEASNTGHPVIRPLAYVNADEESLLSDDNCRNRRERRQKQEPQRWPGWLTRRGTPIGLGELNHVRGLQLRVT
jgi:alpha-glucosidase (family GH31 glycosyl hydrolase)